MDNDILSAQVERIEKELEELKRFIEKELKEIEQRFMNIEYKLDKKA